jgi:CheY-like chemotaxis protein
MVMDRAVLVVDDDKDFRDLVAVIVESMGARVLQAATAPEGIAVLSREQGRVGLVLLDYFMPGMSPREGALALSEVAGTSKIVLCTAAVDPRARASELGLTRWLGKPFSLPQLQKVVREAFEGR